MEADTKTQKTGNVLVRQPKNDREAEALIGNIWLLINESETIRHSKDEKFKKLVERAEALKNEIETARAPVKAKLDASANALLAYARTKPKRGVVACFRLPDKSRFGWHSSETFEVANEDLDDFVLWVKEKVKDWKGKSWENYIKVVYEPKKNNLKTDRKLFGKFEFGKIVRNLFFTIRPVHSEFYLHTEISKDKAPEWMIREPGKQPKKKKS